MLSTYFRRIASVPFANKDAAKALGCTWVSSEKAWQINKPEAEAELAKIEGVVFGWILPSDKRSWNAGHEWAKTLPAEDQRGFMALRDNAFSQQERIVAFVAKYS